MSTTPFVLQDIQQVSYGLNATDFDGNVVPLPAGDTLQVDSSATGSATVVPDATPAAGFDASGQILGGATLGSVTITATAIGSDGVTPDASIAAASLALSIVASAPTTIGAFTLGTPTTQPGQ